MSFDCLNRSDCTRRSFLRHSLGCAAYVSAALALTSSTRRRAFAAENAGEVVAKTDFARVEKLSDGAWAVISTPQGGQFTTLSNGGIIAGDNAVLAIEGFMNPAGATWLADVAEDLIGRRPTHVVMTHFHSDHIGGLAGYAKDGVIPRIVVTKTVRDRLAGDYATHDDTVVVGDDTALDLDLGGKAVRFMPRRGHTPSDLTIELVDPRITWCGDLFWNGLFPNYVDAIPTILEAQCRALLSDSETTYVPGHGAVADATVINNYLALLGDIEAAARKAHAAGTPADEAFKNYVPPASLGDWAILIPNMHRNAFVAWEKALNESA